MSDRVDDINPARKSAFARWSQALAHWTGKPSAFLAAAILVVVWALSGPFFDFNDTWQLLINTTTTLVTFLMVFIIQSSQNRDTAAMQIKLDELVKNVEGAREQLLDLEDLDDEELEAIQKEYQQRAEKARQESRPRPVRRPGTGRRP